MNGFYFILSFKMKIFTKVSFTILPAGGFSNLRCSTTGNSWMGGGWGEGHSDALSARVKGSKTISWILGCPGGSPGRLFFFLLSYTKVFFLFFFLFLLNLCLFQGWYFAGAC